MPSHVLENQRTNEQLNEAVVIGDVESSLENSTVHDFHGKKLMKRRMIPGKLYCTWLSRKKSNETENEFLCSNLRLHILVSSKVQNSVGVSKGVDFKSGTFSQREGNLPISVAVAIKNHSLCKNRKFTGDDFKRIREPPYIQNWFLQQSEP